ncbi:hypothetical protein DPMN_181615 [Dreissena polymorpha]|uniref:Uncharacterized protein n=1 Tax=Dreissena polymorpha TaxID=45954 RepID=A0A9D4DD81_DREPO|nr:hypothetical protein DPMN_181615 [Dreissena polymorpha]
MLLEINDMQKTPYVSIKLDKKSASSIGSLLVSLTSHVLAIRWFFSMPIPLGLQVPVLPRKSTPECLN